MAARCDLDVTGMTPMVEVIIAAMHDGRLRQATPAVQALVAQLWDAEYPWPGTVYAWIMGAQPDTLTPFSGVDDLAYTLDSLKLWLGALVFGGRDPGP